MAESAADRKARLKSLRAARDTGEEGGEKKKLRFRNYLPASEALGESFEPPKNLPPPDVGATTTDARGDDNDDDDDDAPARAPAPAPSAFELELARVRAEETDESLSVVPKDPNWDLKRDLEPKLAVLRKRTQKAIVEILRARLKADGA